MQRKVEKEVQGLEMASDNTPAPLVELLDGFMEKMVGLVGDVNEIKEAIWALVEGVGSFVELMERWMEKMEDKVDERSELELENEEEEDEEKDKWTETEKELEKKDKEEKEEGETEKGRNEGNKIVG